ncbi:hypothetical protein TIFTF001_004578 [Ficus carica]|uniref:Uncharacterized protein n=1 Tax=Ficus carica TaxID=3494 RepID=A0AA87ZGN3_FICCA|nr:hypothetical protein TIFTF001_004578 [Ficus carica]
MHGGDRCKSPHARKRSLWISSQMEEIITDLLARRVEIIGDLLAHGHSQARFLRSQWCGSQGEGGLAEGRGREREREGGDNGLAEGKGREKGQPV